jgi:diaminohydroxyphosphoribosylaminopyrimidine deaminase/5-amino-6-(5-phosphoribosylamino)uracil reductase
MPTFTAGDYAMMARALRLAERGAFTTKPNPMVGCVLSKDGAIVGEGWHQRAGGPHAEVFALQAAGEAARGATAYVTLEPCSHIGRTGPCTDALVAAGVARVVCAMRDPNPLVLGRGCERLQEAGVVVEQGLMEPLARQLNRAGCRASNEAGRGCGSSWRSAWTAAPPRARATRSGSAAKPRATTCSAGVRAAGRS